MKILFLTFSISITLIAGVVFGAEKSGAKNVILKEGGAVASFSEEDGFKLSSKAIKNLGVEFKKLQGKGPWLIPKSSLLKVKYSTLVYRKWDNWITMVLVKVLESSGDFIKIQSADLQDSDEIAIQGVPFLRMTDSDLNSDTVDSCSH